jgi:hypothetical protein
MFMFLFKDKDQELLDFLDALQKEYLSTKIRSKVYRKQKDRKYYNKVLGLKRSKIEDISYRNGLPDIFNDKKTLVKYRDNFYNWGLPEFTYRDREHRHQYFKFDVINYFSNNAEVIINDQGAEIVGKIYCNADLDYEMFKGSGVLNTSTMGVKVRLHGEKDINIILLKNIRRIL